MNSIVCLAMAIIAFALSLTLVIKARKAERFMFSAYEGIQYSDGSNFVANASTPGRVSVGAAKSAIYYGN
jgi:hypothetical protein